MKKRIGNICIRFFLIVWSALIVIPFAMMFLTSVKNNTEFYESVWSLPKDFFGNLVYNYSEAWIRGSLGSNFLNTVIIATAALVLTLGLSAMVSYAIARRKLKVAGILYGLYVVGLMVPGMAGLTTLFLAARALKLFNTRLILIIVYASTTIPFCVFVMTSFFKTIPRELEEAAAIDGASPWRTFGQIILPLVRPAFVSAGIFCFLDYWSDYMYGLMFVVDNSKKTISMGMLAFRLVSGFKVDWGVMMAACTIFIAPVVLIYIFFQKQIMGGLTAGSVKG